MIRRRITALVAALAITLVLPSTAAWAGKPGHSAPVVSVLNSTALGGLGSGSTIGPDGALYVTNGNAGTLVRIDPRDGSETVVGSGLPPRVIFVGGAMDVAFVGHRAYVLVTAAGSDFPPSNAVMGIYRLKRDGTFSVFADLGTWSAAHPPADPDWNAAQGLQYSFDVWRDGFVVADAHLGRVIRVDSRGHISELLAFPSTNSVPTGLEVANGTVEIHLAVLEHGPDVPRERVDVDLQADSEGRPRADTGADASEGSPLDRLVQLEHAAPIVLVAEGVEAEDLLALLEQPDQRFRALLARRVDYLRLAGAGFLIGIR